MRTLELILENAAPNYVNVDPKNPRGFWYVNHYGQEVSQTINGIHNMVGAFAGNAANKPVFQWFEVNFINWLRRLDLSTINASEYQTECFAKPIFDYLVDCHFIWVEEGRDRVKPKQTIPRLWAKECLKSMPEWAAKGWVLMPWGWDAFMEGTIVEEDATFGGVQLSKTYEVQDFLRATVANGGRIDRMSVPDAFRLSEAWHNQSNKEVQNDREGQDYQVIADLGDGYKMVRIISPKGLDYESFHMNHCVGKGGFDRDLTGSNCILSVRNIENKPEATISCRLTGNPNPFNYAPVEQIKGKHNGPVPKYLWPAIQQFFHDQKMPVRYDARNIGLEPRP